MIRKIGLALAMVLLIATPIAYAGGSNDRTPYTVTAEGITFPEPLPAHGHVNIRLTDGTTLGLHFDPNNGHPGSVWIGHSFLPWSAFGLTAGCIKWVQVSRYNEHYGEGGQPPICLNPYPTGEPSTTPPPTEEPTTTAPPTEEPTTTTPPTEEPTEEPTTEEPTEEPTTTAPPIEEPTEEPTTEEPTPTWTPTEHPTESPSPSSSPTPSSTSSPEPSVTPSSTSPEPSEEPTPTSEPTSTPTWPEEPSSEPTPTTSSPEPSPTDAPSTTSVTPTPEPSSDSPTTSTTPGGETTPPQDELPVTGPTAGKLAWLGLSLFLLGVGIIITEAVRRRGAEQ